MSKKCLKCDFEYTQVGPTPVACPNCGAVYAKVEEAAARGHAIRRAEPTNAKRNPDSKQRSEVSAHHDGKRSVPTSLRLLIVLVSVLSIVAAFLLTKSGRVPFVGAFFIGLAPDLLLVGACGLCAALTPSTKASALLATFIVCLPLFGINTRLPSLYRDLVPSGSAFTGNPVSVPAGTWVKLASNIDNIRGRNFPYAGARRSCIDEVCFTSDGFRMPFTGVSSEYWQESVRNSLLQKGLSLSGIGKPIATLKVTQRFIEKERYVIDIEILNEREQRLAHASEMHRIGFPHESPDDTEKVGILEYLLHANTVSQLIAGIIGYDDPYPVYRLIEKSFNVPETQKNVARSMEMTFDAEHPTLAEAIVTGEYSAKQLLPYEFKKFKDSCNGKLEVRSAEDRMIPEKVNGISTGTRRGWWPFTYGVIPIRFVKDEAGKLIAYLGGLATLICDDNAIYAITDGLEARIGHTFRYVIFDYQGVAQFSLKASVKDPPNEWSRIELPSLVFSSSRLAFNRWYMKSGSDTLVRRQTVDVRFPPS